MFAVNWLCWIAVYLMWNYIEKRHRKEIERIHESYKAEREGLLDRIMANNIQEFKVMNGGIQTKKSESGNFLIDRMESSLKKKYTNVE